MWTRNELKTRAKAALKPNYWRAVLVSLFNTLFLAQGVSSYLNATDEQADRLKAAVSDIDMEQILILSGIILSVVLVMWIVQILIGIFLKNPFKVGVCSFFIQCRNGERVSVKEILSGFTNAYGNVVKTMFLRDLFTYLWSLLLVVPGVIKYYAWMMVPYILAEHPDMDAKEARRLSAQMMEGNKWKAFVLSLSFLGWEMLGILTLGILNVFYVNPYYDLTMAELYHTLKTPEGAENVVFGNTD